MGVVKLTNAMPTPLNIAVIGCGIMGARHARIAADNPETNLAAVADVREDVAQALADECGGATVYTDADALLADDNVDVVVLALPTGLRSPIALRAFEAGKHVLLEKPVALNADDLRGLIAAKGDRVGAVCSSRYRFLDSAKCATAAVAEGKLGDLRIVRFRGVRGDRGPNANTPPAWRVSHKLNGGGIFVNWGSYDLDYVLGITGWQLRPRRVLAMTWPCADHLPDRVADNSDAETHALGLIHCDNNIALSVERAEFTSLQTEEAWQIIGAKGSLRLDMLGVDKHQTIHLDKTQPDGPLTTETIYDDDMDRDLVMTGTLGDLVDAIRTGRPPMTSLENALVMQQITDALYESSSTGHAVEIH